MKIVFTPDWFLGGDVFIEIFSFVILFLFVVLSARSYRLSKNKNSLYLGMGFLFIAIAELASIFTKFVLYYDIGGVAPQIGRAIISANVLSSVDIFYHIGFFYHKFFTLLGLYIIYRLPLRKKRISDFVIGFYFIIISALFGSVFYYLFHISALILLVLIINNYCEVYSKNKISNTKILVTAFIMLALSQLIFILSKVGFLYVIGQIIQLIGYVILLFLIFRILKTGNLKHGKKEESGRNNIRYVGNNSRKKRRD